MSKLLANTIYKKELDSVKILEENYSLLIIQYFLKFKKKKKLWKATAVTDKKHHHGFSLGNISLLS